MALQMRNQVIVIHGGDTFETYEEYLTFLKSLDVDSDYFKKQGWKSTLQNELGNDFEVIAPHMPNKQNAKFVEWKIWFEKLIPHIQDNAIFVGHSLGGIFLAKYLSENTFPKKIKATLLVAAPFDAGDSEYTLADFILPDNLSLFEKQGGVISLYQSKDDPAVPFVDLDKYKKALSSAKTIIFEDKGHFTGNEFPEIISDIKDLIKK